LVKDLRNDGQYDWTLVLPPWGRIGYHWQERDMEQSRKRLKTCNSREN
jgi:peptide-O-fucosyltransferase